MSSTLQILVDVAVKGKDQLKGVATDLKNIDGAAQTGGMSMKSMALGIGAATAALGGMVVAGKQAWELFKDAASIEFTQKKFDNLAASINSTGDALIGSLRNATRGMVSDLELMASASELVSLGLTKTEDETVRLASVSGQLGWNMQQVVLTLANMSTMRLDALGLSVEEVTTRAKELEAAGMAAQEAFKMAVIEAGEAKLEILGVEGGSALEEIKQLEASWSNFVTGAKTAFLNVVINSGGLDLLDQLNRGTQIRDLQQAARDAGMTQYNVAGIDLLSLTAGEMTNAQAAALERIARISSQIEPTTWQEFFQPFVDERTAQSVQEMGQRYSELAANFFEATSGTRQRGTSWKPIDVESLQRSDEELAAIQRRLEEMDLRLERRKQNAEAFAAGAEDPLQLNSLAEFNALIYEQAVAAGASIQAIVNLGQATGQLTEEQAAAARVSYELERQWSALNTRIGAGSITDQQYLDSLMELYELAQDGNLGGLIQAAVGTGYGTVAPETQAMKEYMQEWRAMEGLEVSPTIDVEGGTGEVNTIRDTLMEIDKINAAPSVSIGGSWASDINAIRAAMAELEAWSPGAPATPAAPSSSPGGSGNQARSGGRGNTHVVNYIENYNASGRGGGRDDMLVELEGLGI